MFRRYQMNYQFILSIILRIEKCITQIFKNLRAFVLGLRLNLRSSRFKKFIADQIQVEQSLQVADLSVESCREQLAVGHECRPSEVPYVMERWN